MKLFVDSCRIYDALHLCAAELMNATSFVTFNAKHFSEITELRVVDPAKETPAGDHSEEL